MKVVWNKQDKEIYLPPNKPVMVDVPTYKYISISGEGNPNSDLFKEQVAVLYSYSYSIKMLPKSGVIPKDYYDYTVYPLEGDWGITRGDEFNILDKDTLIYTIMIRQPDFVDEDLFNDIQAKLLSKKKSSLINDAVFSKIQGGLSLQMMHIGSYDQETESFKTIHKYMQDNDLNKVGETHREIYISDPRRVSLDKLRTVLRYKVRHI